MLKRFRTPSEKTFLIVSWKVRALSVTNANLLIGRNKRMAAKQRSTPTLQMSNADISELARVSRERVDSCQAYQSRSPAARDRHRISAHINSLAQWVS
jgi:hypothetical protein